MNEIVISIVVVAVLLAILTFLFIFVSRKTNILMKSKFVEKTEVFDFLIKEKEEKIAKLDSEIEDKQKQITEFNEEIEKIKEKKNSQVEESENVVLLPKGGDFEDKDTFENYKKIKNAFDIDPYKIINEFLREKVGEENENYPTYCSIKKLFSYEVLFKISSYLPKEQLLIVNELLNEKQKEVISPLLNTNDFKIVKFMEKLDNLIEESDPQITILVGNKKDNYNYMNKNIKTIYDENITEGFKIVYKNIVYDYSI